MDKTVLVGTMNARTLVEVAGDRLLGRQVLTEGLGYYPGGEARVVELAPDPGAPEILFAVEHPVREQAGRTRIGVFEWEEVLLL
jgi:hypothetical protein